MSSTTELQTAAVTTAVTPPTVPSFRPWPTAFDPGTLVNYALGIVSSVVNAFLSPFAAGLPAPPADPTPWALLAWVRREFFNQSPSITPVIKPQENGLITGNVGAVDPDGDPLTYTVIGRPLNGGNGPGRRGRQLHLPADERDGRGRRHRPVHRGRQRRGRRLPYPRAAGVAGFSADPGRLPISRRRSSGRQDHHRQRHTRCGRRSIIPDGLLLGRGTFGIPGRGRARLTRRPQLRLVQVGARSDQPAAGPDQRSTGGRAGRLRLLRHRRATGSQRAGHEHLPDGHRVEPHLPEFNGIR